MKVLRYLVTDGNSLVVLLLPPSCRPLVGQWSPSVARLVSPRDVTCARLAREPSRGRLAHDGPGTGSRHIRMSE